MCWLADGRPVLRCYPGKALALVWGMGSRDTRPGGLRGKLSNLQRDDRGRPSGPAPGTEVKSTTLEELEGELESFDPQVVISSGHKEVELGTRLAWIELSVDPTMPTKISVGGRHFERSNPTVEELLEVIEEVG